MEQVITIGLDLAKNVFQVDGIDAAGKVLVRRQLRRGDVLRFFGGLPRCLVGIEACATAHYWARQLTKLGHTVRLMPPAYVKPYVKRGKTDVGDAPRQSLRSAAPSKANTFWACSNSCGPTQQWAMCAASG